MKKGRFSALGIFCAFLFIAIMAISAVSAEIMLSQPNETYNIDDDILASAILKSSASANSLFEMSLLCNDDERTFFVFPAKVSAGEEKKFETSLALSNSFLQGARGNCRIKAGFISESAETAVFKITESISISLSINRSILEPGESILISGEAIKANKKPANGYAQLSVTGTNISAAKGVENGRFSVELSLPEHIRAGEYSVMADVYEKDIEGKISNNGIATAGITIKQVPKVLEIVAEKQDYMPGENLSIKPVLYDQTDEIIASEISIGVFDTNGNDVFEKLVKSDEEILLYLEKNATAGKWQITAKSMGKEEERLIFVKENEEALFELQGNLLKIANIGNVPYRKNVEIRIGNETEIRQPDVGVGESIIYELEAPDGDYEIIVNDGISAIKGSSYLTGNAVSVNEMISAASIFIRHPLVWVFLVLVMAMFLFVTARNVIKRNVSVSTMPSAEKSGFIKVRPEKPVQKINAGERMGRGIEAGKNSAGYEKAVGERTTMSQIQQARQLEHRALIRGVKEAESTLVQKGVKEDACVAVIKIKNFEQVRKMPEAIKVIDRIPEIAYESKAVLEIAPGQISIILSPTITRTFGNDSGIVKIASKIANSLNEHNRRFDKKIEYGI
ncbi:hypothetical protein HYT92_03345, partial [Candidatus Pacearchaeota archaeon]|nr:hypothetical protein [Candidatus Pacearchaeota archaeon]